MVRVQTVLNRRLSNTLLLYAVVVLRIEQQTLQLAIVPHREQVNIRQLCVTMGILPRLGPTLNSPVVPAVLLGSMLL